MRIGIIGAMEIEVRELIRRIQPQESVSAGGTDFLKGAVGECEVIVARCGVGKVFAAACTQAMILTFRPDYILNIGVCGAVSEKLDICDVVLGEKTLQYDMDTSAVGDPVGLISGINKIYFDCDAGMNGILESILKKHGIRYLKGVVATGDRFLHSSGLVNKLREDFNAVSGDMESAGIAHVCYINNTPFGILRAISDKGDENSGEDYELSRDKAAMVIPDIAVEFCMSVR